jgi:hypothetical protein
MEGGTCLRCGKPYEPADTVCYSCGAPIGETKTPTQPIRTVRTPPVAPPSEPTHAPTTTTTTATTAIPRVPRPPVATKETTARVSGRHRRLWLGLGAALLILLAAGGGFYLVRGLTAGPPVSSQSTYRDPQYHFSFREPTLWTTLPTANGVELSDSDGTSTAVIEVVQISTPQTASDYAEKLATEEGLGTAPKQFIGGVVWEQRSGLVTDLTDGVVHKVVLFVTVHNGLIFTITFSCPIASYMQISVMVYQPLLASFTFDS